MCRVSGTTGLSVPVLSTALQPVLIRQDEDDEESGIRLISALLDLEMMEPFALRDLEEEEEEEEEDLVWKRRSTYESSVQRDPTPPPPRVEVKPPAFVSSSEDEGDLLEMSPPQDHPHPPLISSNDGNNEEFEMKPSTQSLTRF